MTALLDITPGRMVFSDIDGRVVFDTAERMPHRLGIVDFTGTASWPKTPGEVRNTRTVFGYPVEARWTVPAFYGRYTLDMGPWSGPPFDFFIGRITITAYQGWHFTTRGNYASQQHREVGVGGSAQPWIGGSKLVQTYSRDQFPDHPTTWLARWMLPEIEDGRLVMALYQHNRFQQDPWNPAHSCLTVGSPLDITFTLSGELYALDL